MSVAIYQYDQLTQNRITVLIAYLLNVMCGLLDTHTPFDFLFSSTIPNSGNDTNDVANAGANKDFPKRRHSKRKRILKESKIRGRNSVLGGYRFPREMQDTGSTGSRKGDDYDLLARLYFSRVAVWESPSVESWLQVSAEFDVYWPNGDPVLHWKNLEQIEWACVSVLNTTINTNIFWSTLVEADPEGEYVVRRGKRWGKRGTNEWITLNFSLRGGLPHNIFVCLSSTSLQTLDKAGIAAVDTFKNEYILDFTEYETDDVFNDTTGKEGYQYSDRLELEWEVREWFGLGLCLATLVFASLLAILSVCLQRRQETQEIWDWRKGVLGNSWLLGGRIIKRQVQTVNCFSRCTTKSELDTTTRTPFCRGAFILHQGVPRRKLHLTLLQWTLPLHRILLDDSLAEVACMLQNTATEKWLRSFEQQYTNVPYAVWTQDHCTEDLRNRRKNNFCTEMLTDVTLPLPT